MKRLNHQFGFSDKHWAVVKKYLQEFDTAEKRTQALLQNIKFKGCSYCGKTDLRMYPGGRSGYCSSCRIDSHVTAGTFFHGISRLDVMHPQFHFFEAGIEFSSNQIKTMFNCAYSTAWEANRRIQRVITEAMGQTLSAIFSGLFEPIYLKRSLETPANQHPREEQAAFSNSENESSAQHDADGADQDQAEYGPGHARTKTPPEPGSQPETSLHHNAGFPQATSENPLLNLIGDDPISYESILLKEPDSIAKVCLDLLQLELDGLIEKLPGDRYVRKKKANATMAKLQISSILLFEQTNDQLLDKIGLIVAFLKEVFHGTSRKYLQLFLGTHWFYHDKEFWRKGELFQRCLQHDRITLEQIKSFKTPVDVQCFLPGEPKIPNSQSGLQKHPPPPG